MSARSSFRGKTSDSTLMRGIFGLDEVQTSGNKQDFIEEQMQHLVAATPFSDLNNVDHILVQGATIVNVDGESFGDVLIEDGIVKEISSNIEVGDDVHVIDGKGFYLVPGSFDSQSLSDVSLGEDAPEYGGTTAVEYTLRVESAPSLSGAIQEWKAGLANSSIGHDASLRVGLNSWSEGMKEALMDAVKQEGVNCFILDMAELGTQGDKGLLSFMEACKEAGAVAGVKPRNCALNRTRLNFGHVTTQMDKYLEGSEPESAFRAIKFAEAVNVPLLLTMSCHPSTLSVVQSLKPHQRDTVVIEVEGHLTHDLQLLKTLANQGGHVVFRGANKVGSEPESRLGRLARAWMLTSSDGESMSWPSFVALSSGNLAKVKNLYPKKGAIVPGADANMVLLDPQSSAGFVKYVLFKGKLVVHEGKVLPPTCMGGFLESPASSPWLYDTIQDRDRTILADLVGVERHEAPPMPVPSAQSSPGPQPRRPMSHNVAQVRQSSGRYQRPLSAHGIRNQQDSTFTLA